MQNHVEHVTDWQHYLEYWRYYRSGQFVYIGGLASEWRDQSELDPGEYTRGAGRPLNVGEAIYRYTEVFELASRLSLTDGGDDEMCVEIGLHNIDGFDLYLPPSRAGFPVPPRSFINEFTHEVEVTRDSLVADPRSHARKGLSELFQRFKWDPGESFLTSMQDPRTR